MNILGFLLFLVSFIHSPLECAGLCDIPGSDQPIRLTEWTGAISSPGWEGRKDYPNFQDCTWEIKVARGSRIQLTFETFKLEPNLRLNKTARPQCLDYVKVSDSSGEIFYDCDSLSVPRDVMSLDNLVTVYFHSDESDARRGFNASYTGICESEITTSVVLATPNFPNLPPVGVTCTWKIGRQNSLANIVKPGKGSGSSLPTCGRSPLTIISNDIQDGNFEICSSENTQAYSENITLVYDAADTDMWFGEIIIELANDTTCSRFCVHSSGCNLVTERTKINYNCVCQSGFEGITCEEKQFSCFTASCINGSAYCMEERDAEPGSRIFWSTTLAKQLDTRPCPGGATGQATRRCIADPQSYSGGLWTRPNLSKCVNTKILQILKVAEAFAQNFSSAEMFFHIISDLVEATDPVLNSTSEWHPMLPGDLVSVIDVLGILAKAADEAHLEIPEEFIKKFIQTVDNVVDPKATDIWRNALASLVETKISEVIESTQKFVTHSLKNYLGPSHLSLTRIKGAVFDEETLDNSTVLEIVARNLDIKVLRRKLTSSTSSGAFNYLGGTTSIQFPGTEISTSPSAPVGNSVNIYLSRFSTVSTLLSISETRFYKDYQNDSNLINSDVVSVEFLDIAKTTFNSLKQPVVLTFSLQDPVLRRNHEEKCVFMNMSAETYRGRWLTSGCLVGESNQTHLVCYCHHLTNFAILMDVYNSQDTIDTSNKAMLTYISYVGGSLSILACIITIVVFQYFKLSSDRIRIHQHLGLSIIFVQILFICMGKTGKEYNTPVMGCRIVASLLHYSLTSMFCWMLVEGTHLYIVLVRVFKQGSHFKKYLAVGWGIPLIIVGISIGAFHDRYGMGNLCWLDQEMLLACFAPTVGIVIVVNTVILIVVIRVMVKSNNSTQKVRTQERNNIGIGLKATAVLLPLLGLTWVFGFLAINAAGTEALSYIFTYLFTITNSFQGVLFFVFHCLLNVDVRQAFDRRYNRKKRLSYVETTSSRLRKLSEPDAFNGNNMLSLHRKNTNSTLSILNNLSPGDRRSSNLSINNGQLVDLQNMDRNNSLVKLWPM